MKPDEQRVAQEFPGGQQAVVLQIGDAGFQVQDIAQRNQDRLVAVALQDGGQLPRPGLVGPLPKGR